MESIKENREKSNRAGNRGPLKLAILVILVGIASFGLGRLSAIMDAKPPITVHIPESIVPASTVLSPIVASSSPVVPTIKPVSSESKAKTYVAAKAGKAYYLPSCSGVGRIKEENKVYFATKASAESAGYSPALNCPGL